MQALVEEMVGDADSVGDDGEGGIDGRGRREAGGVDDVEVVEVVSFAVWVEDGSGGISAHAAGAVLVADALERNALLEVSAKGNGGVGVAGLLEGVDPAIFEAGEAFDVVGSVGETDAVGRGDEDGGGFVEDAGVG